MVLILAKHSIDIVAKHIAKKYCDTKAIKKSLKFTAFETKK